MAIPTSHPPAPTVERRKVFGEMAHQLIIVGRDDPGLYEALCADWAGDKDVAVIFDRRVGQRRHAARALEADRRQADRRRETPVEALLAWRGGGRAARKMDVLSALNSVPVSVAVRHRPLPKVTTPRQPPAEGAADEPVVRKAPLIAPPGVVVFTNPTAKARAFPLTPDANLTIAAYEPNRETIVVRASAPARIATSEVALPGWRLVRNGERWPIAKLGSVFIAFEAPAGESTFELIYRPVGFEIGVVMFAIGIVLLALLSKMKTV